MCVGRSKMPNHWRWYHFAFLYREERTSLSQLLPSSQMTETSSLLTFCHLKHTKSDPPDGKLLQTSTCSLSLEVLSEVAVFGQPSLQLSHLQIQEWECTVCACTHSGAICAFLLDSERASALMGCRRRWPNRVKVVQETTSVTAVRGMMSGCQDCFAESLSLLVDLFQQTPNTTANLCMHL